MKASCLWSPRLLQVPDTPHTKHPSTTSTFWLAVILVANFTSGNASDLPTGARAIAMAGTYVALANTAEAVFHNPGGLNQLSGTEVAIFYQKPFGLEDVNWGTLAASVPIRDYRASLGLTTLSNGSYSEQALTLAWSQQYKRRLYYGIGVRYKRLKIDGYGSSSSVGLELGLLMPLSTKFSWGASAQNVGRSQFGSDEQMPQILRSGVALAATPELVLALEIFKDVRFDEEVRFGVEYRALQQLAVRAGMANHPDRLTAGFGLDLKPFILDYAFFTHNDLGATHQLSLTFRFGGVRPAGQATKSDGAEQ